MLDPSYMHQSDYPGISIVTPSLNNQNYHSWSQSVKVSIRSKNKLGFLGGTLSRPNNSDRTTLAWDRWNTMVMTWITNSIESEIAESILWMDTVHKIWKELQDRYHQDDIFRVLDLQEEIFTLRQGDSSITQYFTSLKKPWQELEIFRPIPQCLCTIKCSFTLLSTIKQYHENDYVIRFLKGLNEQYSTVRSSCWCKP